MMEDVKIVDLTHIDEDNEDVFLDHDSDIGCCRTRSQSRDISLPCQRWKICDDTFNKHLENIWGSFSDDKKASFAYLDSLCFWLYQRQGPQALRLIKKQDIFSKKYVFVPIVCWDHWRLVIFCHFGEVSESETRSRCILLLDSVEMGAEIIGPDLRRFIFDIFMAEGRPESRDDIYHIPLVLPQVPQQTNVVDCGRFVLYFIQKFMDAAPENFSLLNGYPYFLKRNWFGLESFLDFCDDLEDDIPTNEQGLRSSKRILRRSRRAKRFSHTSSPRHSNIILLAD